MRFAAVDIFKVYTKALRCLPTGSSGGSDFEKLLIEPILDSMEIYPADPEVLAQYHVTRAQKCHDAQLFYDSRGAQGTGVGGGLGSSHTNNYLRDCGYEVDEMPRVESMDELIIKNRSVIGTPGSEQHLRVFDDFAFTNSSVYRRHKNKRFTEDVRFLSKDEYYKLKEMLLVFRPRIITPLFDYPGDWYSYASRPDGDFGFRQHAEFGDIIDMADRFDSHTRLSFIIAQ